MKQKSFFMTLTLSILMIVSQAFGDITRVEGGYRLTKCGLTSGSKFTATVRETGDSIGGQVDQNGCLKTTFRDGRARPGNNIIIEVGGSRFSETVPGGNGGGYPNPVPNPYPQPEPPQPAPQPSLPSVDLNKVQESAENQARMVANRVVDLYGDSENFRYNLYMGLRKGVSIYNWQQSYSYERGSDYRSGVLLGESDGRNSGLSDGRNAGSNAGSNSGRSDAANRFRAVVDMGTRPDLSLQVPEPSFSGLSSNLGPVKDLNTRVREKENEFRNAMNRYSYYDDTPFYTVYGWQSYQFDLVRNWYRGDWAWNAWLNHKLGGNYENMRDYYDRISDRSRTANWYQAQEAFVSTFKRTYNRVIDDKWDHAVRRPNPGAFALGLSIGQNVASGYARDLGYNAGYARQFTNASIESYSAPYKASYRNSFESTVMKYQNNVIIERLDAHLVDSQNETQSFVPGAPVGVVIENVTNAGSQNGKVSVTLSGPGVVGGVYSQIEVQGLSSNKGKALVLKNLAKVASIDPNTDAFVTVSVGGKSVQSSLRVNFSSVALAYGSTADRSLLGYMKTYLNKEFVEASGDFYNKNTNTLLHQLVAAYTRGNAQQKATLAASREELRAVFGKKPSWLSGVFTKSDDRFAGAQKLIDQLR